MCVCVCVRAYMRAWLCVCVLDVDISSHETHRECDCFLRSPSMLLNVEQRTRLLVLG